MGILYFYNYLSSLYSISNWKCVNIKKKNYLTIFILNNYENSNNFIIIIYIMIVVLFY